MKTKIKTIDIQAKEWFDKTYGNSYFAGVITINFGTPTEKQYKMPFQYGSKGMHEQVAFGILKPLFKKEYGSLWQLCRDEKIIMRSSWSVGHKQKELKNI